MHFAPDTEEAFAFIVALGNTHASASQSGTDELDSVSTLAALLAGYGYSGRIDHDVRELEAVRATRDRLRQLWHLELDEIVREVNRMLREARAQPFLTRHDHVGWHLHATEPTAALDERIRVEVAIALVDLIRAEESGRMRDCEADDCDGIMIDRSRNGSRRFCSVRCSNRVSQIAYRERAARGPDT